MLQFCICTSLYVIKSGLQGWAFTIPHFAKIYSSKFGISKQVMSKKLWGNNYFNGKTRSWVNNPDTTDKPLERSFLQFIINPIKMIAKATLEYDKPALLRMISAIGIVLEPDDIDNLPRMRLVKVIMRKWINAADNIYTIINNSRIFDMITSGNIRL